MKPLRNGNKRKISLEQRHQLIQIFLHMGYKESQRACVECGLHENYAVHMAREISVYPKKVFRGGGRIAHSVDHTDKRWAWAIERGAVIA
jgi:hypothetical protein